MGRAFLPVLTAAHLYSTFLQRLYYIYQSVLDQEIITHEIYYLHFIKLCKQDSPNFIKTAIVPDGTYLTTFSNIIGRQ